MAALSHIEWTEVTWILLRAVTRSLQDAKIVMQSGWRSG